PFSGHVTTPAQPEQSKNRAVIGMTLDSFRLRGQEYRIDTSTVLRESPAHRKRNFIIDGGAGLGAAIGAIAGGGKSGGGNGSSGAGTTATAGPENPSIKDAARDERIPYVEI